MKGTTVEATLEFLQLINCVLFGQINFLPERGSCFKSAFILKVGKTPSIVLSLCH